MAAKTLAVDPLWEERLRPQYVEVADLLCPRRHNRPARLFGVGLINSHEEQRLSQSNGSDSDLALDILRILRSQPPGSFNVFCEVLLKVGDPTLRHIESRLRPGAASQDHMERGHPVPEHQGDPSVSEFAEKVKRAAARLGGFWEGCSQIPVEIMHAVCGVAAEKPYDLADRLSVTREKLLGKAKTDINTETVRNILQIWIHKDPDGATLDKLFTALKRLELLNLLKVKLRQKVGEL